MLCPGITWPSLSVTEQSRRTLVAVEGPELRSLSLNVFTPVGDTDTCRESPGETMWTSGATIENGALAFPYGVVTVISSAM